MTSQINSKRRFGKGLLPLAATLSLAGGIFAASPGLARALPLGSFALPHGKTTIVFSSGFAKALRSGHVRLRAAGAGECARSRCTLPLRNGYFNPALRRITASLGGVLVFTRLDGRLRLALRAAALVQRDGSKPAITASLRGGARQPLFMLDTSARRISIAPNGSGVTEAGLIARLSPNAARALRHLLRVKTLKAGMAIGSLRTVASVSLPAGSSPAGTGPVPIAPPPIGAPPVSLPPVGAPPAALPPVSLPPVGAPALGAQRRA